MSGGPKGKVATSYNDPRFLETIQERYPIAVPIMEYAGDWGMGAGKFEMRFADYGPEYRLADAVFVSYSRSNYPIGHDPMTVEVFHLEELEPKNLLFLRDALDSILASWDPQP